MARHLGFWSDTQHMKSDINQIALRSFWISSAEQVSFLVLHFKSAIWWLAGWDRHAVRGTFIVVQKFFAFVGFRFCWGLLGRVFVWYAVTRGHQLSTSRRLRWRHLAVHWMTLTVRQGALHGWRNTCEGKKYLNYCSNKWHDIYKKNIQVIYSISNICVHLCSLDIWCNPTDLLKWISPIQHYGRTY